MNARRTNFLTRGAGWPLTAGLLLSSAALAAEPPQAAAAPSVSAAPSTATAPATNSTPRANSGPPGNGSPGSRATGAQANQRQTEPSQAAEGKPSAPAEEAPNAPAAPPNPHANAAHGMNPSAPPQDLSGPDSSLPAGQISVQVVDENMRPVSGAKVNLLTLFQSIAEGNNENVTSRVTGGDGRAVFEKLSTAIRYSYALSVERLGATYDVQSFRLSKVGHSVLVHTYPVTADPKDSFIGLQGYISVQPRADLFRIDGVYRVINMSRTTWRPQGVVLSLPGDAQAVEAKLSAGDAGFEQADGGMRLVGTFPPGQKDLPFAFHVPNTNEENRSFELGIPPHMVDFNVLTEAAPGLSLEVSPSFPSAEERRGRDEKKVLVTRRVLQPGEAPLQTVEVRLSGLPVIGPGRWIALTLAAVTATLSLGAALLGRRKKDSKEVEAQREKARTTLLDEMLLLQKAFDSGAVGPRTYEQTKREIMTALARLEPLA